MLGAAALAVVCLLGVAYGPEEPAPLPLARIEAARAALRVARVEAPVHAPRELAQAIAAAELLERRLAEERSALVRRPGSGWLERLAEEAQAAAFTAIRHARAARRSDERELAARRAALAERLAALQRDLATTPADRALRSLSQQARLDFEAAAAAGQRGDLATAAAGLDAAAADLADAELLLGRRYARLEDPQWQRRWQVWVDETVAESRDGAPAVVVDKRGRRCYLLVGGEVAASFPADLGQSGLADKLYAGDAATPEGRYRVVEKRDRGATTFYRALMLDYPNDEDRREYGAARRRGLVPRGRGIGGLIEIHGHGGRRVDWTNGCVAVRNAHMDRLFAAAWVGMPVTIVGTARLPGAPAPHAPHAPNTAGRAGAR